METPQLSIVIPMLNESENIDLLFKRMFPVLKSIDLSFEVIAIDDGSTDDTLANMMETIIKKKKNINDANFLIGAKWS